ncbi:MAG: hypothetical protein R6V19_15020 [Armatimonadota bacterium]
MPKRKADWEAVEREYVTGDVTYAKLAEKHGVVASTVRSRGAKGNWGAKRDAYRDKVNTKSIQKSQEKISEQISEIILDTAQINEDAVKRLHREILDDDNVPNSLEGVANALDKALRTHEFLTGGADSREEHVHSGPGENVMRRGLEELVKRIRRGEEDYKDDDHDNQ